MSNLDLAQRDEWQRAKIRCLENEVSTLRGEARTADELFEEMYDEWLEHQIETEVDQLEQFIHDQGQIIEQMEHVLFHVSTCKDVCAECSRLAAAALKLTEERRA